MIQRCQTGLISAYSTSIPVLFVLFVIALTGFYSSCLYCNDIEYDFEDTESCQEPSLDAPPQEMSISLAQGVQLAMTAERRLGSVQGNVLQSELNLELAASDFDWFIIPKVDAGMIGGGRAGVGATFGMGAEFNKKFASGTRISIIPSMMKAAKDYQSNLRMSVTQPLLRGCGKTFTLAPLKAAQYANRSALRQLYLAQTNQVFQAIRGLYEIARQQAIVGLDKESFERMEKFVVSTKIKEKIGMCDSLDIYRAQTEFKLTEDSLSHSLERLQDAKDNLRDILGIPLDIPIKAEVVVEYDPIEIDQSEAITTALRNRIEISQAEDQYQETRRLEHLAGSNLRPEINLVIDYTSFSWDEAFTRSWSNKRESKWGIGFISSGDPWNTREQAAYDMSRFASVDAGRNVEQVRDNVILEVKRAIRDIKRAHEKINLSEEQIENSKKGYYLARLKFEYGMANNFDLLQAEKSLRQSQIALVNAIVDHRIGEFRLLGSLGMLIEKPMVCQ